MNNSDFAIRTARLCDPGGEVGESGGGESGDGESGGESGGGGGESGGGFQAISHQKILWYVKLSEGARKVRSVF